MKIIIKPRGSGKTTELIEESAKNNYYIVCATERQSHEIVRMAEKMNLEIPFPLTYRSFLAKEYHGKYIKGFLIDDADYFLERLTDVPVKIITLTAKNENN